MTHDVCGHCERPLGKHAFVSLDGMMRLCGRCFGCKPDNNEQRRWQAKRRRGTRD